jgi:hypothetical protein
MTALKHRKPRGARDVRIAYSDYGYSAGGHALSPLDRAEFAGHHAIGPRMEDVLDETLVHLKNVASIELWETEPKYREHVEQEWWDFVGRERICVTQAPRTVVQPHGLDSDMLERWHASRRGPHPMSLDVSPYAQVEIITEGYGRKVRS